MGNKGSWSDGGTNFCFNAAKIWANKWYESYHVLIDPTSNTYDGTLVGINAVKDGTIAATGQDVVLNIASSGEINLYYVMFNRKVGANIEVPQYGDQVVITEQYRKMSASSSWQASLSSGEEYTQSNWLGRFWNSHCQGVLFGDGLSWVGACIGVCNWTCHTQL
jgi:hypothetical protein